MSSFPSLNVKHKNHIFKFFSSKKLLTKYKLQRKTTPKLPIEELFLKKCISKWKTFDKAKTYLWKTSTRVYVEHYFELNY